MKIEIKPFTKEKIDDVIQFELNLRKEESIWGWPIDENYISKVTNSFDLPEFDRSISLLAYVDAKVVGRIDSTMIASRFDGSLKAYLDWICVIKSYRHYGVAQIMMASLKQALRDCGVDTLIALIASDEPAQRFYRSLENSKIKDEGIWIDI